MQRIFSLAIAALLLCACDQPEPETASPHDVTTKPSPYKLDTSNMMRSSGPYDWCDLFTCVPCPTGAPCPPTGSESIIHCCNEVGICVHVELAGDCDPEDYIVICRWGTTNEDGTITCYQ